MSSAKKIVANLNLIAMQERLNSYCELADYLKVKESTLKGWMSNNRVPSLQTIDMICNSINIESYILIRENSCITPASYTILNNSHQNLKSNLAQIFLKKGKFSWDEKTSLFCGFLSEDILKSYFRRSNPKSPPLDKLDEMASALGVPPNKLIKPKGVK